jgi:hypothetical protein
VATGPGRPMWIGSSTPRSRTRRIHVPMTLGEKHIWLTMYVASGALSNIAWIVGSPLMKAGLSG